MICCMQLVALKQMCYHSDDFLCTSCTVLLHIIVYLFIHLFVYLYLFNHLVIYLSIYQLIK